MYIPQHYKEESWDKKRKLIQDYPLATVITIDADGTPVANHFPFYLHEDEETGKKFLQTHLAKKNHQLPSLQDNNKVLVIFQSANSYISPSYYPEKERTHKFVPTWDFASLHIKGKLRVIDDFDFVRSQLNHFTDQQEAGRECPWKVDDAPENYTRLMQKAITGLEIEVVESDCKFKFEQKMTRENVDGTINGLACDGLHQISNFVKECNLDA
ncbi:negative transcriptional regulator [Metschnikowia bicuspidata var. bicuspidata NRRL YB-4993]|uniref:Negative transcriptional regulator n=1 Tax=Metschnikowia bicuspidata var. bicuspidata NRRL YB-4993 TaxID=869754 RepID=A0A1A0H5H2_9ASCO|nr:negative transcriptional regulator [Metschnikowia bicuspidata var. bicuspidata NRRL YB-4993]OBA19168.1 negative transcriptional regulator [Metschnikowia bicuspidata var. bicuspidata NRRL YB-4993]